MVPEIWSMMDNFFLPFCTIFYPSTTLITWKIKILKKWKKHLEISSFYQSVLKIMIISYTVPNIQCMTDVIFIFHFRLFFALLLLPPNDPKKLKLKKKNEKNAWRYHHFTHVYLKLWSHDVRFLRHGAQRTDRQTDRQAEKVTYKRWVPHLKMYSYWAYSRN